jgi:hypothetical protein
MMTRMIIKVPEEVLEEKKIGGRSWESQAANGLITTSTTILADLCMLVYVEIM